MKSTPILFICQLLLFTFLFSPSSAFTQELEFPSSVTELSKGFSGEFCIQTSLGIDPDKAGEFAAKKIVRGLLFSPNLNEIISVPKEELALLVSNDIYSRCGKDLQISKNELNDFLSKFADKDRVPSKPKPFKPFGIG